MLHGIGAPGAPGLGAPRHLRRRAVESAPLQCAAQGQIPGRPGIRVAERAHRDSGSGPGADAAHGQQATDRFGTIGAAIQCQFAAAHCPGQLTQRGGASRRESEAR